MAILNEFALLASFNVILLC